MFRAFNARVRAFAEPVNTRSGVFGWWPATWSNVATHNKESAVGGGGVVELCFGG